MYSDYEELVKVNLKYNRRNDVKMADLKADIEKSSFMSLRHLR
jgi:hypothetical protein